MPELQPLSKSSKANSDVTLEFLKWKIFVLKLMKIYQILVLWNLVQKIKCKKFSAKNLVQKILVQEFERDLSCDSICKKLKLSIQSKLRCDALKFSFFSH